MKVGSTLTLKDEKYLGEEKKNPADGEQEEEFHYLPIQSAANDHLLAGRSWMGEWRLSNKS